MSVGAIRRQTDSSFLDDSCTESSAFAPAASAQPADSLQSSCLVI